MVRLDAAEQLVSFIFLEALEMAAALIYLRHRCLWLHLVLTLKWRVRHRHLLVCMLHLRGSHTSIVIQVFLRAVIEVLLTAY